MILLPILLTITLAMASEEARMHQARLVDEYREYEPFLTGASCVSPEKVPEVREWLRRIEDRSARVTQLFERYYSNIHYYQTHEAEFDALLQSIRDLADEQQPDLEKTKEMYERVLLRLVNIF